jgi:cobalamin biosynthesis protein CobT
LADADSDADDEFESGDDFDDEVKGSSVWENENPESIIERVNEDQTAPSSVAALLSTFMGHGDHDKEIVRAPSRLEDEVQDPTRPAPGAIQVDNHLESVEESGEEGDPNKARVDERAIGTAVTQAMHFDKSSEGLRGSQVFTYPVQSVGWYRRNRNVSASDYTPAESIVGRATLEARTAFANNKRSHEQRNLKSGRVDASKLGRRPAVNDPRLFKKRTVPGKKDYFVLIGIDCSGSTARDDRMEREKRIAFGVIEMLNRVGGDVKFAVYGHSGGTNIKDVYDYADQQELWTFEVKGPNEPWNSEARDRLCNLLPIAENFDGHTIEAYRKILDARTETDRTILYFTDGAMPAAHPEEEEEVLREELQTCSRKGYTVLGVGIDTDSPTKYGLPTVAVRSDEDVIEVVRFLGKHLQNGR